MALLHPGLPLLDIVVLLDVGVLAKKPIAPDRECCGLLTRMVRPARGSARRDRVADLRKP